MSSPPWCDFPGGHFGLCNISEPESFIHKILDAGYLILDKKENPTHLLRSQVVKMI